MRPGVAVPALLFLFFLFIFFSGSCCLAVFRAEFLAPFSLQQ